MSKLFFLSFLLAYYLEWRRGPSFSPSAVTCRRCGWRAETETAKALGWKAGLAAGADSPAAVRSASTTCLPQQNKSMWPRPVYIHCTILLCTVVDEELLAGEDVASGHHQRHPVLRELYELHVPTARADAVVDVPGTHSTHITVMNSRPFSRIIANTAYKYIIQQ